MNDSFIRRWGSSRTVTSAGTANRPTTTIAGSAASASGGIRVRGRIVRAAMRGRSGNSWLSTRPVIPASAVPEELVAQVCGHFNYLIRSLAYMHICAYRWIVLSQGLHNLELFMHFVTNSFQVFICTLLKATFRMPASLHYNGNITKWY